MSVSLVGLIITHRNAVPKSNKQGWIYLLPRSPETGSIFLSHNPNTNQTSKSKITSISSVSVSSGWQIVPPHQANATRIKLPGGMYPTYRKISIQENRRILRIPRGEVSTSNNSAAGLVAPEKERKRDREKRQPPRPMHPQTRGGGRGDAFGEREWEITARRMCRSRVGRLE